MKNIFRAISYVLTFATAIGLAIIAFAVDVVHIVLHPVESARNAKHIPAKVGRAFLNPSGGSSKTVVNLFKAQGRNYNWQAGAVS